MKSKIIAITLMLIVSTHTTAQDLSDDDCNSIESIARQLMQHRQSGTNLKDIMSVFEWEAARTIVLDAYGSPRYSLKKNQDKEVDEFANKWYLSCLKAMDSEKLKSTTD